MAVAAAAASIPDIARSPQRPAGEKAAVPFTMLGEDPSLQPYREEGHMSFGDFIDIINPLQHIPLVSTIYRELTGDTISQPSRVMGGFLYGGPLGGMGAVVNVMVEDATGKDIGGQILSVFSSNDPTQTAQNTPPGQPIPLNPQAVREQQAALAAQSQPPMPSQAQTAQTAQAQPAGPLPPLATAAAQAGTATAAVTASTAAGKNPGISEEQAASLREQLLAGQYHPSRMPARDTTPANTLQAKQAAALAAQRRLAMNGATASGAAAAGVDSVPKAQPAAARASQQAPMAVPPTAAPANDAAPKDAQADTPVPPAMLSDVMMRNLAKYEAAKKALNPTIPTLRTAS